MKNVWGDLEHQVWQELKAHGLESHSNFILAVSGGLDSMVLLELFLKIKPRASLKVAYFDHGPADEKQESFRRKAALAVKTKVESLNSPSVVFCTAQSEAFLLSEEKMRNARWEFLNSLKQGSDILVTAHHLDDRLETMLLKLVRGTGPDAFDSFQFWNGQILRPLLTRTKVQLRQYAELNKLGWVEDPSNLDEAYLRNWLRNNWLPLLDEKLPGASQNLALSLFKIASRDSSFELVLDEGGLSRQWYVSLATPDQLRGLALFLKKHHIRDFTSGQLEEIRKRLDKNQKDITFEMLGRKWVINTSRIMLQ